MRTISFFSIVIVIITCNINIPLYGSEYPIGCYSLMSSQGNYYVPNQNELCQFMQTLGYNNNIMETYYDNSVYQSLLTLMESHGLKATVIDKTWSTVPTNNMHYSTHALTTSSYNKFEAEYTDGTDVNPGDGIIDKFWYGSRSEFNGHMPRVGHYFGATVQSGYVWRCLRGTDNPGYAYTDLRYRWPYFDGSSLRIGNEFIIKKNYNSTDKLYITFRIKISNVSTGTNPSDNLVSFITMGYVSPADSIYVTHTNGTQSADTTYFTYNDYLSLPVPIQAQYFDVVISINYSELVDSPGHPGLMKDYTSTQDSWFYNLINLNPRVYWYGNCDLYLDYIEIEDQIHRDMRLNHALYDSKVQERIDYLKLNHANTITNLYSFDEPNQPQFDSYKLVKDFINTSPANPGLLTATYDFKYNQLRKSTNSYYNHLNAFRENAQPSIEMPDIYPIRPEDTSANRPEISYNPTTETNKIFIQDILDLKLVNKYKESKVYSIVNASKFYPVIQSFGNWKNNYWHSWILPPYETQKCLRYLPLCYGADGIIDYKLVDKTFASGEGDYCALINNSTNTPIINTITFNAIHDSNEKIKIYGKVISDNNLVWQDADCIMTNGNTSVNINAYNLDSLKVKHVAGNQPYEGYIQCGYFWDSTDNAPYFMLANRRANYFIPSGGLTNIKYVNPNNYNTYYLTAPSQTVRFEPSITTDVELHIGTHVAFYEPYDSTLYQKNTGCQNIDVPIGPGDGKLLQMVGTLPSTVATDASIKSIGYIQGTVNIENGANVVFDTDSDVTLYPYTVITVQNGSTLTINGKLTLRENAYIDVVGGNLILQNANCKFDNASGICAPSEYDNGGTGSLSIISSTLDKCDGASYWKGISVKSMDNINIENSLIKDAKRGVYSVDTNLSIFNTRFEIPHIVSSDLNHTSVGVQVANPSWSYKTTFISGDNANSGFNGDSAIPFATTTAYGISISGRHDSLYVNNQVFNNLHYGICGINTLESGNNISTCYFTNCVDGIFLISNLQSGMISDCVFSASDTTNIMTGIHMYGTAPAVTNCQFINCGTMGILVENPSYTHPDGIYDSDFSNCEIAIAGRGASCKIADCSFTFNQHGIQCFDGSNFNLKPDAHNQFYNEQDNINFIDYHPYLTHIQLERGHNDFYHIDNEYPDDFAFDNRDFIENNIPINADYNWFQDNDVRIHTNDVDDDPGLFVKIDHFDPLPHLLPFSIYDNRYFTAIQYECDQRYEEAYGLYQAILDAPVNDEKEYLSSCADGIYRISLYLNQPNSENIDYFDEKVLQYAVTDPYLSKLLVSYLMKEYLLDEDFQSAIDLIQPRIDNPISEIDSLRAVLDIEIILQLANYGSSKGPINTTSARFRYKDVETFTQKHDENWAKMLKLLSKEEDNSIPIPPVATLYQNFPNPFNPSTTISFAIPKETPVKVNLYNIKGQIVKQLCNQTMKKGQHRIVWDGKNEQGRSAGSGIYLIRLETKDKTITKKAMMLK